MALGTLAQPWAWDAGAWVKGSGTNKGMWARDAGSWKVVKELYAHNGTSWNKVHPVHGVSCTIVQLTGGTCNVINGTYRIDSAWSGPQPQWTSNFNTFYQVFNYERKSSISQADLLSRAWSSLGSTGTMTSNNFTGGSRALSYVITTGITNRWMQAQARLAHSVDGELTTAQGGVVTSVVWKRRADPCNPPP